MSTALYPVYQDAKLWIFFKVKNAAKHGTVSDDSFLVPTSRWAARSLVSAKSPRRLFQRSDRLQSCQRFIYPWHGISAVPVLYSYDARLMRSHQTLAFSRFSVNKKSTSPVFSVGWCLTNRFMSALINRQGKLSQVSQPSVKRFGWHYKKKLVLSFCSSGGFSVAFPVYSIWAALSIKKWTLCETIKRGVVFRDNASLLFVWKGATSCRTCAASSRGATLCRTCAASSRGATLCRTCAAFPRGWRHYVVPALASKSKRIKWNCIHKPQ